MVGCVLAIRGPFIVKQPIGDNNLKLLWNGEVYGNNVFSDVNYELNDNDTQQIFENLKKVHPLQVFSEIEGCFAFVVWKNEEVWFGRDFLGRRSLVISRTDKDFTISSIGPGLDVPTGGIFRISLKDNSCTMVPWPYSGLITPSLLRFTTFAVNPVHFSVALRKSVYSRTIGAQDIGILFSGGLDCSVLAALTSETLALQSKIFLLNVAFSQSAPDRATAVSSYEELKSLHPNREFVLVLIDINQAKISKHKNRIIKLLGKNDSRMDFSIATALYFASKGKGYEFNTFEATKFTGKVLLSGMGADEIFGGYSRYKSSFKHYGQEGVIREMSLDIDRLWHRNLGRDDRVTACHSKELRFPYLDTFLWQSLAFLRLDEVTQPEIPGKDKFLLREFAKELGFQGVSGFKKRAIQFGTRISQLCNVQDFGSNRKAKGWQSISKDKDLQIEEEIEWCCQELNRKIVNCDDEEKTKYEEAINRLKCSNTKINDKRHIMRVYLGDYISALNSHNT